MSTASPSQEIAFIEDFTKELSSNNLVFPTSVNATMKIRDALGALDIPVDKIARLIAGEPVLSAQVLRMCNSAAYSAAGSAVTDLRKAVLRMGLTAVRNVALAVSVRQMMQMTQSQSTGKISPIISNLWQRCLKLSALSYMLASRLTRVYPETALVAGLLLKIGEFYIVSRAQNYPGLLDDEIVLGELINRWQASIGTSILTSWELPEEISLAVLDAGDPEYTHLGQPNLTDVLTVAEYLEPGMAARGLNPEIEWGPTPQSMEPMGLDLESSIALLKETRLDLQNMIQSMS